MVNPARVSTASTAREGNPPVCSYPTPGTRTYVSSLAAAAIVPSTASATAAWQWRPVMPSTFMWVTPYWRLEGCGTRNEPMAR